MSPFLGIYYGKLTVILLKNFALSDIIRTFAWSFKQFNQLENEEDIKSIFEQGGLQLRLLCPQQSCRFAS